MKILFWGTPEYAVSSLDALVGAGHELVGVVSQPDRRRGRGRDLRASPVKARAAALDLPMFTPERISRDDAAQRQLADLKADVSIVVAYGQILPGAVLSVPPLGCWNGHGSLLPRWRGAAPIQWALLEGDSETGVGIMAMEAGLDTGPVLLESRLAIGLLENATHLAQRMALLTAELLTEAVPLIEAAGPGPEAARLERLGVREQSSVGMTYARQLRKPDVLLDWSRPALEIHRRVMGLHPAAQTHCRGKVLKVLASEPLVPQLAGCLSAEGSDLCQRWADGAAECSEPGTVLAVVDGVGLVVATGDCPVLIREAQLEGKTAGRGQPLIQQLNLPTGARLGREDV